MYGNVTGAAPTASDGNLTVTQGQSASGTLSATPPVSCDTLTYAIGEQPDDGTVTLTNAATGAYTYTPTGNYFGMDRFTFTSKDNYDGTVSIAATVTITVNALNRSGSGSGGKSGGGAMGMLGLLLLMGAAFRSYIQRR